MNKAEALQKRPCNLCIHRTRCQVVDYIYSPCKAGNFTCLYETDKNNKDYHGAFELDSELRQENE